MRQPVIYIADILRWADEFHDRRSRWPNRDSGRIVGMLGLTWCAVDLALKNGGRGLPGKSSLAKLLAEQRGVRHRNFLSRFTIKQILAWADAHNQREGSWPIVASGPIREAPGETWLAVNKALANGTRGLPGGSSLAKLLAEKRGVRKSFNLPPLSEERILFLG